MNGPASGKANALTVVTPLIRGFGLPTRVLLGALTLLKRWRILKFWSAGHIRLIHNGRWMVVPGRMIARDPQRSYLLFSAVYNGPWDQYIDAFSLIPRIRAGVNLLWLTSSGFPKARRLTRFKRYIRYHETPPDAFYTAYPQATVRDIEAALELRDAFLKEPKGRDVSGGPSGDLSEASVSRFYLQYGSLMRSASTSGAPHPHNARPGEDS